MDINKANLALNAIKGSSKGAAKSSFASSVSFKEELASVNKEEIATAQNTKAQESQKNQETEKTKEAEAEKISKTEDQELQEAQKTENKKTEETENLADEQSTEVQAKTEDNKVKSSTENISAQIEKQKLEEPHSLKESKTTNPIDELSSKIAALNEIKSQNLNTKAADAGLLSAECCKTINLNQEDTTFLLNLVQNQNMTAQGVNVGGANASNNLFTEIKSEATQKTVQVSATFLDALNESMKTNKPFRIDFDNDVAVIMKVDKNGVLSANFIPGSSAVEAYLRNNISSLRQSFEEQGLAYNELSYSNQQKHKEKQEKKENKNE